MELQIARKTIKMLILGVGVIGILAFTILLNNGGEVETANPQPSAGDGKVMAWENTEAQVNREGVVEVTVIPVDLKIDKGENTFRLTFNTHSVDLDYDFTEIIELFDDSGNTYKATEWLGEKGGHHLGGEIVFPKLQGIPRKISMVVIGVDGVDRTFEWEL